MPLQPVVEMASRARAEGYAIGYFEAWNLESLYGVVEAAERARAPVFIGFNGEFLSRPERAAAERLSWYGALGKAAAADAKVPCGLVFNECSRDDWTRAAATAGFNLVMPADSAASYEDYRRRVGDLVRYARPLGVAIEAELGELPSGEAGFSHGEGEKTDAELARAFVEATGVDLLAVSVGNVHGALAGRAALDLERLKSIRRLIDVPLVLHGGTGIADESLREAVALGVAKVNYGAGLKLRYLEAVRRALASDEANPHALLGMGGPEDAMIAGRRAVREAVAERLPALGCAGRA
jgi:ketose-bisphosphate aldolase